MLLKYVYLNPFYLYLVFSLWSFQAPRPQHSSILIIMDGEVLSAVVVVVEFSIKRFSRNHCLPGSAKRINKGTVLENSKN